MQLDKPKRRTKTEAHSSPTDVTFQLWYSALPHTFNLSKTETDAVEHMVRACNKSDTTDDSAALYLVQDEHKNLELLLMTTGFNSFTDFWFLENLNNASKREAMRKCDWPFKGTIKSCSYYDLSDFVFPKDILRKNLGFTRTLTDLFIFPSKIIWSGKDADTSPYALWIWPCGFEITSNHFRGWMPLRKYTEKFSYDDWYDSYHKAWKNSCGYGMLHIYPSEQAALNGINDFLNNTWPEIMDKVQSPIQNKLTILPVIGKFHIGEDIEEKPSEIFPPVCAWTYENTIIPAYEI